MSADLLSSVTRITDFERGGWEVRDRPRESWATGDYVCGRVTHRPDPGSRIENTHGRRVEVMEGETLVGALGTRQATLDKVGGWRDIGDDGLMDVLTLGGVLGRTTSVSPFSQSAIGVEYLGHVTVDGEVARMRDYAITDEPTDLDTPVVLVLGTSMSAGKTMSGRVITRVLVEMGYRVAACKFTGAGAYKDVLSMDVSGAEAVYDFVDAGLPTTVVPEETFREAIRPLLARIQTEDVIVAEVGASPLEPYNGDTIVDMVSDEIAYTVVCASDPYAVVGLEEAFGRHPDLVAGIATNTSAGIELVGKLTDCPALNLHEEAAKKPLEEYLATALNAR